MPHVRLHHARPAPEPEPAPPLIEGVEIQPVMAMVSAIQGMEEWSNKALPITRLAQMPVQELNAALPPKDLQVLDVRTPGERQDGYIPGSTYVFLPELEKKAERLDQARPVAVYCDSGYRASLAASLLVRMGFKDVRNVPGSWKAWKAAGYAVQKPKERKKGTDTNLS